jgi:hypothetical protein
VTEDELLAKITGRAAQLGIKAFHEPDSRKVRIGKGFPDLVLAGNHGVIFAELKSGAGKMTADQVGWRWQLLAAGAVFWVWRPVHWAEGDIEDELRRIA